MTYTIVVSNGGPDDVTGATVTDVFPADVTGVSWTCAASGGASCAASGSGDINETVDLPNGSQVTYTAGGSFDAGATGIASNTASVAVPTGVADPDTDNNSATDSTTMAGTGDPTLVAHFEMEEGSGTTLVDSSTYGNDAVLHGSPAWATGVDGLALDLDGSTAYALAPGDPSLDIQNQITLALWMKPERQVPRT